MTWTPANVSLPLKDYAAEHFKLEIDGKLATVTLNRPERKNPLTFDSYSELGAMETAAELILGVPITSEGFIYIFLPALLFQSALMIDTRRMLEDAVPIFILAVIAVLVSTGVIGLALFWTSGMIGFPRRSL